MEIFEINVYVYTDTRMGGSNPSYKLTPCLTLESATKAIKKTLNSVAWRINRGEKIPPFEIKLNKKGQWSHDFNPEIITVTKIKIK